jgi:hypothetical protein
MGFCHLVLRVDHKLMLNQEEFDELLEPIDETSACEYDGYVGEEVSRLFNIKISA